MRIFLFIPGCFLFITGCTRPLQPEYRGIDHLQISKISAGVSVVSANIKFYNPNNFPLQFKHADISLLLNDKLTAHCLIDSTINISPLDSFYIPANFSINLKNIFSNIFQLLVSDKTKVNAEGFVKLKKSGLVFTVPFHYETYQNLDSLLQDIR